MPQIPQIDTGSIVGPGLETAERIKGARTRRSLAEMALRHGPAREDRQRRSEELDIQAKQRGAEVGEEELEYKRHQRMLTAGLASLPNVQDLDQYNQWAEWMYGKGAKPEEIPRPVEGMKAKDFKKFKQEVLIEAAKIADKYGIEGYGPTLQMKAEANRMANQLRIEDKRMERALATQSKAGKEVLSAGELDDIYIDVLERYYVGNDMVIYTEDDKGKPVATGYKRLKQSDKDAIMEEVHRRKIEAEGAAQSFQEYDY